MDLKYVVLKQNDAPIVLHWSIKHSDITNKNAAQSAGFCQIYSEDGELKVNCYGKSSSLGIGSNPEFDSKLIRKMQLKYVILRSDTPVIFHSSINHCDIGNKHTTQSAGFCSVSLNDERIEVECWGKSQSLKVKSNPEYDSKLICKMILKSIETEY